MILYIYIYVNVNIYLYRYIIYHYIYIIKYFYINISHVNYTAHILVINTPGEGSANTFPFPMSSLSVRCAVGTKLELRKLKCHTAKKLRGQQNTETGDLSVMYMF